MKSLIIFAFVAVLLSGVLCDFDPDDSCENWPCDYDECCVSFPHGKFCVDKGDDVGDFCGGQYQCSTCSDGLVCAKGARGFNICQRRNRSPFF